MRVVLAVGDMVAKVKTIHGSTTAVIIGAIVEVTETNRHISGMSNKRYYTIEWASDDERDEMIRESLALSYRSIYEKLDYFLEQVK